jgi:hypothetical protein
MIRPDKHLGASGVNQAFAISPANFNNAGRQGRIATGRHQYQQNSFECR